MPFRIRRRNEKRNQTVRPPQQYPTRQAAFDAAMDNVIAFIKAHWQAGGTPGPDGPAADTKFKILIERRAGRGMQIELRYDYPIPGDQETNSVYWRIIEI